MGSYENWKKTKNYLKKYLKNYLKISAVCLALCSLHASVQAAPGDPPAPDAPATDAPPASEAPAAPAAAPGANDPVPESPAAATPPALPAADPVPAPIVDTTTTGANGKLQSFVEAKETKKFTGKPITVQVKEAELSDVFRLIAEASGFNIIVGEDVKGKITLSLIDVPWDQALDVILHTKQLGAERNNNILRIVTLSNLTQEKQAEMSAKKASEATAPRITQIFPISYADIKELAKVLGQLASSNSTPDLGGGGAQGGAGRQDPNAVQIIQTDERTNSIIVRDLPENIERMKKIVEMLDTQTPQVMIEAKIIEANEDFAKSINGNIGFAGLSWGASMAGNSAGNTLLGATDTKTGMGGVFATGADMGKATGPTASQTASGLLALGKPVSLIGGIKSLSAMLNIGESEQQLRILTSPKLVVQNKVMASVESSEPVLVTKPITQNGVLLETKETVSAKIGMQVTPTVTNNNNVILDLNIQRGYPSAVGVSDRTMKTKVVVESGVTLVIGGIYTVSKANSSSGFPFLRKIPIIGALFGAESETNKRSEIFIFVTPRILNEVESGLAG